MNEPIKMSVFGMITNQCSELFCKDKDGLELWLNIANECFYDNKIHMNFIQNINQNINMNHSPLFVGIICSLIYLISFFTTYFIVKYNY
jgi:hypothetical protein